jgi:hypothetical protein
MKGAKARMHTVHLVRQIDDLRLIGDVSAVATAETSRNDAHANDFARRLAQESVASKIVIAIFLVDCGVPTCAACNQIRSGVAKLSDVGISDTFVLARTHW